jgi:NAD(P)H dehydrogenase (quinone)
MTNSAKSFENGIFAGTNDVVKKIGGRQRTALEEFITKHREAFA